MTRQPSKRALALERLKYAGYHGDTAALVRLYVQNRISYPVAQEAYRRGQNAKIFGVKCTCSACTQAKEIEK